MATKNRKWACLTDAYDQKLLVPISLLEKILEEAYVAKTEYREGRHQIHRVAPISSMTIHDQEEIDMALAQQALEG